MSQHQSSHQKEIPCRWKLCWRAKLDSAWGMELQSHTLQFPLVQLDEARACPAMRSASGSLGSLSSMLEWMFKVTSMPWERAQWRKEDGEGKRERFHSQPFQSFGAFQSVSSERVLSGTWFATNSG